MSTGKVTVAVFQREANFQRALEPLALAANTHVESEPEPDSLTGRDTPHARPSAALEGTKT